MSRFAPRLLTLLAVAAAVLGVTGVAQADPPRSHDHHHGPNNAPGCQLTVPANPLSAAGLATPYRLSGCDETNATQSAFVEATVLDPATGALSVYHPLVINAGTTPAVTPTPAVLPAGAVVGIWFGSNADLLTFAGPGAGQVVGGLGDASPFGQFGYINAPQFFAAANAAIKVGKVKVPDLGVGRDGQPCPTTRSFDVVDQDQSDNVATAYRIINGKTAQNTAITQTSGTKLTNGSDEGLLANFIDPALDCHPFTAPSLDDLGATTSSLALNELSAAAHQAAPVALVPPADPMTLVNGHANPAKVNLYRAGVDMPRQNGQGDTAAYCTNLRATAPAWMAKNAALLSAAPGPGGVSLQTFLAARYQATLQLLGCPAPGGKHVR